MYAAFFGLTRQPFSIAPDPHYLFMSERHREALAHLLYGIEGGGGFVLLTGEIGAGKTTICRRFLEEIPPHCKVAYIFNPKLTIGDLLKTICAEFHIPVKHDGIGPATIRDYLDPLNTYLLRSHAAGQHTILVIDEAQNLTSHVLEQLRLLTNLETNERKLLQIILIGQPELRQMLARPELEQLAQRVIARFHLGVLNATETRQYVAHRLSLAGWRGPELFSEKALRLVHRLSGGVPRRINLLCDRAMLGAYAASQQHITPTIVRRAAGEVFDTGADSLARKGLVAGLLGAAILAGVGALLWLAPKFFPWTAAGAVPAIPEAPKQPAAPAAIAQPPNAEVPQKSAARQENPSALTGSPEVHQGLPPKSAWLKNEASALSALGPFWGTALNAGRPCTEAQKSGLQCYRTSRMTLHGLRQFDRPAALKLSLPGQGSGYLLVTAILGDSLELRAGEQRRWHAPIAVLEDSWQGRYASLWRTPPGQQGRLTDGYQQPAAQWMAAQLGDMQAKGLMPSTAKNLKQKVESFQRANGIEVNGVADPTTLILINRASGVEEPRLRALKPE